MNNTNQFIMSGKYEVLQVLGHGSFSTVYLARHHSLELERAIKVIPKTVSDSLSVLSEARLLKSLHHPGIPAIYDIEEDQDCYYLVEEYIQGESLEEFLLHQTFISQNFLYNICRQLCEIYIYLHTNMQRPIFYQDLKPAHIILCGNQIKLIDFGASCYVSSSGNNFKHFGNTEFSAPENFTSSKITFSSDIYTIGKLIQYLIPYTDIPLSQTFQHIIQKATESDPILRYETVEELLSDITKQFSTIGQPHLLKKIAVIGSTVGCGTTHFSFSLVATLNFLGYQAYYFEKNEHDSLRKMKNVTPKMWEKNGCIFYKCFCGYPNYGNGIQLPDFPDAIKVTDYGIDWIPADLDSADLILYLCNDAVWHWQDAIEQNDFLNQYKDHLKLICIPGSKEASQFYAKQFSLPVYPYFYDKNPFDITKEKIVFVSQLLNQKGRANLFSILKNNFPWFHRP